MNKRFKLSMVHLSTFLLLAFITIILAFYIYTKIQEANKYGDKLEYEITPKILSWVDLEYDVMRVQMLLGHHIIKTDINEKNR